MANTTRRIYRDISDPSILVKCRECPWWFAIRLDPIEAYKAGEGHEITVHEEEPRRAQHARIEFEKRQRRAQRHAVSA
ncbi:hypothetical protein [Agromyces laixinhei]|uniref:hypothetical protein n=1 Tax=Agromyces laixinhei TaxID=2585717 RepID=UPI0012EDF3E8|nr:hypothetical protein [Agromyces laixinhei]